MGRVTAVRHCRDFSDHSAQRRTVRDFGGSQPKRDRLIEPEVTRCSAKQEQKAAQERNEPEPFASSKGNERMIGVRSNISCGRLVKPEQTTQPFVAHKCRVRA